MKICLTRKELLYFLESGGWGQDDGIQVLACRGIQVLACHGIQVLAYHGIQSWHLSMLAASIAVSLHIDAEQDGENARGQQQWSGAG